MKAIAKGPWATEERGYNTWYQPFTTQEEIDEGLWFTSTQPVATAASSSDIKIAKMMIDTAERFTTMNEEKQRELIKKGLNYKPLFPRIKK